MQNQNENKTENKGFTLLEIVVAMAILSISIVTILQLFSGALGSIKVSDDYLRATILAQNKLNELESQYATFVDDKGVFEEDNRYHWDLSVENYDLVNLHPQFENLEIDNKASEFPIIVNKISLKVHWKTERRNRVMEIVTLKTKAKANTASKKIMLGNYQSFPGTERALQFGEQDIPKGQSEK